MVEAVLGRILRASPVAPRLAQPDNERRRRGFLAPLDVIGLKQGRSPRLIVDVHAVGFLDSTPLVRHEVARTE